MDEPNPYASPAHAADSGLDRVPLSHPPAEPSAHPANALAPRLVVNSLVAGPIWCAVAGVSLIDPDFSQALVLAYGAGGFTTGVAASVVGTLTCRHLRWSKMFDLPVGGAMATAIPPGLFGAVFGYNYPIAEGVGMESYLLQAFLTMIVGAVFGAAAGAQLGFLAALPAHALLWAFGKVSGKH